LLVVTPIGFLVAIATVFLVLAQTRRHWWEPAAVSAVTAVSAVMIEQFATGDALAFHFAGVAGVVTGNLSLAGFVLHTAPVGVPLGVLAGCVYVGFCEAWSGGAEWHPIEQRRRVVGSTKAEAKLGALLTNADAAQLCAAPPLGVSRGGDLTSWIEGSFVVVPPGQFPAMGLIGESGSGKTVTAERLVSLWARAGRKVMFADFKGSDPELAERVIAAYKSERPDAGCALWPAQPLDMWRGSPQEIANRLLQVQDYSEPYYEAVASTAVRLAVLAPDVDGRGPVTDSQSFLERLDVEFLRRAYEGSAQARDVASVTRRPEALDGVRLRYSGFFSALAGRLDHGFSFEDVDLAVLTIPTLAQQADAMAVARMVLTDFGAYCLRRKPRVGEDVTLIVDEFSAVTAAAPMVIDLAERVRDVGGQVVVSAQSYEGLGRDDSERRRMLGALAPGGLIVHRMGDPDEVLRTAGTVRAMEQSWQLEPTGHSGMGTVKMAHKMRVDPDAVRQAKTGEAWVITQGKAAHMTVLRTRISQEARDHAERLVSYAWMQAAEDFAHGIRAVARPWWEVPALPKPAPQLEAAGFAELVAGPSGQPTPELPPGRPSAPDPRLVLAIAAYVRARMFTEARRIAARTPGLADPEGHLKQVIAEREAMVAAAQSAERSRRRRRT
jgi:hypothetical protein